MPERKPPNDLKNYGESSVDDVWRDRQENEEAEFYHQAHRHHAEKALLEEAAIRDARILNTAAGDVTITYSKGAYSYDTGTVDKELFPLIERDGLTHEWNQFVRHSYKIDKRWLNRLGKRGKEYRDILDRMVIASTGSPTFSGPSLKDMGGYAPE